MDKTKDKPVKILFLINALHTPGGTERVTTILANLLTTCGYDTGIVCLHGGGEPFFALDSGVKLFYIHPEGFRNIYTGLLSNIYKLRQLYKQERPDYVIDVCSAMSLMSIPASLGGITKVITWEHFNSNVDWNPVTTPLSRKLAALCSLKIVTLTRQDARNYRKRYDARNVITIPNPITIEPSPPSQLTGKRVLAIGRFTPQKGFDLLLEAWSKVRSREDGWTLRIIGEGEMEQQLKEAIRELGLSDSVEIISSTRRITEEYRQASIYVLSSRFEGLPLVLIEAMAMGLPIVSFDCETGPRDILIDGLTGVLVEPGDTDQLATELDKLMQDDKRRTYYSENAQKESRRFEPEAIVGKWCELLSE